MSNELIRYGYFRAEATCPHTDPQFLSHDGTAMVCAGCGRRAAIDWTAIDNSLPDPITIGATITHRLVPDENSVCVCARCARTIKVSESCEANHGRGVLYEFFHCADRAACDAARDRREQAATPVDVPRWIWFFPDERRIWRESGDPQADRRVIAQHVDAIQVTNPATFPPACLDELFVHLTPPIFSERPMFTPRQLNEILGLYRTLVDAYRAKRAVDGLNGRMWDASEHYTAERRIAELEAALSQATGAPAP
jgi:hypothetical protein